MNFKPLNDQVLVKPKQQDTKTAGGLFIPETAQDGKTNQGKVLSVGKEVKDVKVGDMVWFQEYGGKEITLDGDKYLVFKESELLGYFRE